MDPSSKSPEIESLVESLAKEAPIGAFNHADPGHQDFVQKTAVRIHEGADPELTEHSLLSRREDFPLAMHLAAKLAKSRKAVANLSQPVRLSVIFAVYKEHHRLMRPDEHESGEDFLRRKVAQLEWLSGASPHLSWELLAVDDGCPVGSGALIKEIAQTEGLENVRVLHLEKAIREKLAIAGSLRSPDESRKGGSILYGMWEAARKSVVNVDHVILYTDADLSTHLGQAGLLIDPIVNGGMDVAMGSRREDTSVVVKKGKRNVRGKLFIYLWKRMLSPALLDVTDTQCGFKAFRAVAATKILDDLLERGFAFDVELLLKAELRNPGSLTRVPIAWIDSEGESTTTALSPYLSMLQSIAGMNRNYLLPYGQAEAFTTFVEALDENQWNQLVNNVPDPIASSDPLQFGHYNEISVDDLKAGLS
jgi:hypothetical protein